MYDAAFLLQSSLSLHQPEPPRPQHYTKPTKTLTLPEIKRVAPEVEPLAVVLRELRASGVALYLDLKTDRCVGWCWCCWMIGLHLGYASFLCWYVLLVVCRDVHY